MPLNNPNASGVLLRPRLRIVSAGVEIPQCYAASVISNSNFQADRFTLAFSAMPSGTGSLAWWSEQSNIPVDIQVGFLPPGAKEGSVTAWQSLQTGKVDKPSIDMDRRIVTVDGRDNSATFIDARVKPTAAINVNQTSSAIVSALAAAYSIPAQITPTITPIGRFWSSDHSTVSLNQFHSVRTEWDLITTLARLEGYDAFFQGGTFYFQPIADPASDPYVWQYKLDATGRPVGNVSGLRMSRETTVTKGVQVIVKSWNVKQARVIVKYSPSAKVVADGAQEYIYNKPNLTDQQAQAYANARYAEVTKHEMTICGDLFGQVYYPQSVTRTLNAHGGFTMQATCRNHNTDGAP